MTTDITLITNLRQMASLPILEDWFDFLPSPPKTLICYTGGQADIDAVLRNLCEERGVDLVLPAGDLTRDVLEDELPLLKWQFKNAPDKYVLRVTLDTIPYRTDGFDWLNHCIDTMEANDLLFTTGTTKAYRTDRPSERDDFALTQRVSFNFFLARPQVWLDVEAGSEHLKEEYGRFYIEGLLEHHCREANQWGLRLVNVPERRIFHVQVWDDRIVEIRRRFRAGEGIAAFMRGYEEDLIYLWDRYYMWPKAPWLKRAQIFLGKWRRKIFSSR